MERPIPSKDEILAYLKEDRNWGQRGYDDQMGAMNMVAPKNQAVGDQLHQNYLAP